MLLGMGRLAVGARPYRYQQAPQLCERVAPGGLDRAQRDAHHRQRMLPPPPQRRALHDGGERAEQVQQRRVVVGVVEDQREEK
jgi:hypothetical protein